MNDYLNGNGGGIGFGTILSELITSDTVTDIELRCGEVWVVDMERGRYRYPLSEREEWERAELLALLDRIPGQLAIREGVPYNDGNPILDAEYTLPGAGQLRINAVARSLTGDGFPGIAIRKSSYRLRMSTESVTDGNYASKDFVSLMETVIGSGCNVMIAGLTGAGKTELLRYLARFIPENDAVITIEDTFEAYLKRIYPEKEVMSLKTCEGQGFPQLIRACLRQNPDWIMLSEARGSEVRELMEAAGTGHHMISTIHADSAENIPWRMVDMARAEGSDAARIFRQVHQNMDFGIYIHYVNDGTGSHRKVTGVCEFFLDGDGNPRSHMLYRYDYMKGEYVTDMIKSAAVTAKIGRSGVDTGKIKGVFLP